MLRGAGNEDRVTSAMRQFLFVSKLWNSRIVSNKTCLYLATSQNALAVLAFLGVAVPELWMCAKYVSHATSKVETLNRLVSTEEMKTPSSSSSVNQMLLWLEWKPMLTCSLLILSERSFPLTIFLNLFSNVSSCT